MGVGSGSASTSQDHVPLTGRRDRYDAAVHTKPAMEMAALKAYAAAMHSSG